MSRLRPHPHRGDVIAAGAIPLAVAAVVIDMRMGQWSLGPRFVVVALIAGLILTMGWLAELEGDTPRPYHSALIVAGLLPLVITLVLLAEVLGAQRPPGSGGFAWTFALEAVIAVVFARRANSAACTLIAAIAGVVAVESFVVLVFKPHGLGTFRGMLLVLSLVLMAGAVQLRDRWRAHAVQLVNAAGVVGLVLGASYLVAAAVASAVGGFGGRAFPFLTRASGTFGAPFGWKLYLLAVGFGLVAYAAVDRERGPGYIGVAVLLVFSLLVGLPSVNRGSLVGWPLFLLVIGAAGLAIGLRPRQPLPPPPVQDGAAPTVPLKPVDER
jgi:hypothetical protein